MGFVFNKGAYYGKRFFEGLKQAGAVSEGYADNVINRIDNNAGFCRSVLDANKQRINDHDKLLQMLGKKAGDPISDAEAIQSMFYNTEGQLQKGRVIGAAAGGYMAANMIGHGSLGIPLISNASWNR